MGYATATDGRKDQLLPAPAGKVYEASAMEDKVVDLARLVKTMQDCQQHSDRLRELQVQQVTTGLQLLSTQLQALCRLVVVEPDDDALCGAVGPLGAGPQLASGTGVPVASAVSYGASSAHRSDKATAAPQLLLARVADLVALSHRVKALEHLQEQSEAVARKAAEEQAQRNVAFEMRLVAAEAAADRTRALLAASAQQAREHERAEQQQLEHGQGLDRRLAAVEAQLGTVMACVSAMHRKEADGAACAALRHEQQQEKEARAQQWGQGRSYMTAWGSGGAAAVGGPGVHGLGLAGMQGGAVGVAAPQGLPVGACGSQEGASVPSQPPAAAEEVVAETLAALLQRVPPHVALSMLLQQQAARDTSHTEALLAMVQSLGLAHHALVAPLERLATLTAAPQQPPHAAATAAAAAAAAGPTAAPASSTPTPQEPHHAPPATLRLPAVPCISDRQPASPCQVPAAHAGALPRGAPGHPAAVAVHDTYTEPQQPTRIPVQPERPTSADAGTLGPSPPPSILSLSELCAPLVQELRVKPTDPLHARNSSPVARKGRSLSAQTTGISGPRQGQARGPLLSSPARLAGSPQRALQHHRVPHSTPQRQAPQTAASPAKGSGGTGSNSAQRLRGGCPTGPRSVSKKAAFGAGSSHRPSAHHSSARGTGQGAVGRGLGSDEEGSRWGWLTEEEEEQVGATWCSAQASAVAALSGRVQTGGAAAAGEQREPGGQPLGVGVASGAVRRAVPGAADARTWAVSLSGEGGEGGVGDPLGALEVAALLRSSSGRGAAGEGGGLGRGARSASADWNVGDVRTTAPPKGGRATMPGHAGAGSKASMTRAKKSASSASGAHKR